MFCELKHIFPGPKGRKTSLSQLRDDLDASSAAFEQFCDRSAKRIAHEFIGQLHGKAWSVRAYLRQAFSEAQYMGLSGSTLCAKRQLAAVYSWLG